MHHSWTEGAEEIETCFGVTSSACLSFLELHSYVRAGTHGNTSRATAIILPLFWCFRVMFHDHVGKTLMFHVQIYSFIKNINNPFFCCLSWGKLRSTHFSGWYPWILESWNPWMCAIISFLDCLTALILGRCSSRTSCDACDPPWVLKTVNVESKPKLWVQERWEDSKRQRRHEQHDPDWIHWNSMLPLSQNLRNQGGKSVYCHVQWQ